MRIANLNTKAVDCYYSVVHQSVCVYQSSQRVRGTSNILAQSSIFCPRPAYRGMETTQSTTTGASLDPQARETSIISPVASAAPVAPVAAGALALDAPTAQAPTEDAPVAAAAIGDAERGINSM